MCCECVVEFTVMRDLRKLEKFKPRPGGGLSHLRPGGGRGVKMATRLNSKIKRDRKARKEVLDGSERVHSKVFRSVFFSLRSILMSPEVTEGKFWRSVIISPKTCNYLRTYYR